MEPRKKNLFVKLTMPKPKFNKLRKNLKVKWILIAALAILVVYLILRTFKRNKEHYDVFTGKPKGSYRLLGNSNFTAGQNDIGKLIKVRTVDACKKVCKKNTQCGGFILSKKDKNGVMSCYPKTFAAFLPDKRENTKNYNAYVDKAVWDSYPVGSWKRSTPQLAAVANQAVDQAVVITGNDAQSLADQGIGCNTNGLSNETQYESIWSSDGGKCKRNGADDYDACACVDGAYVRKSMYGRNVSLCKDGGTCSTESCVKPYGATEYCPKGTSGVDLLTPKDGFKCVKSKCVKA